MLSEIDVKLLKEGIEIAKQNINIEKENLKELEAKLEKHEKEVELNKKKELAGQCFIAKPWKPLCEKHAYDHVVAFKVLDVINEINAKVLAIVEGSDKYGSPVKGIVEIIMPLWCRCTGDGIVAVKTNPYIIETYHKLEHESTFTQMAKHKFYQTIGSEENKNELHNGTIN